ncbi:hypothetical protein [Parasedimentitalea psychrophila]|uniref:Uncharacterized protein n=1 Tax=Parasedimentitalea psychrophila TaxID=2997337 RepID=A0A9Y2L2G6_9RHOB|nr:hypothetical protein [Parasedimentitalea psychrophila]WIY27491.1 hypothetical protein QPJ95_11585 [Parasedimentitalea psychrophila]
MDENIQAELIGLQLRQSRHAAKGRNAIMKTTFRKCSPDDWVFCTVIFEVMALLGWNEILRVKVFIQRNDRRVGIRQTAFAFDKIRNRLKKIFFV